MEPPHILIIGAGVTGLLLAQALRKHNVSCTVFERDHTHREQGWGLAFHWAFPTLQALLPENIAAELAETYCIPTTTEEGEPGNFPFINLETGCVKWALPPGLRRRVVRAKLCRLLETGLNMARGRALVDIDQANSGMITAHFKDGSRATGTHLVGCDGTNSTVRKLLCERTSVGHDWKPTVLPVRFLGTQVVLPGSTGRQLQEQDRAFFQGGDSADSFMLFAIQDTPTNNEREDSDTYLCQVVVSWPFRTGFLGEYKPTDVPEPGVKRSQLLREISDAWASPYRDIVHGIDTVLHPIKLQDWVPEVAAWDSIGGRATLIGDAAHPMTMYRGEAANQGVTDVASWVQCHLPVLSIEQSNEKCREACEKYGSEMINRAAPAVLASRQACLDAHYSAARIDGESPLVSKRKVNM